MKASQAVELQSIRRGTMGMRKPKAPQANRSRIVKAAIAEFSARGFKGASMDAIASRTQTTRALINYYFGGKESLYIAVLEHVYAGIREAEGALDLDHLHPLEAVRRIVEFTYRYYLAHEGFVRLVVAENQAGGRHLRKSRLIRSLNRPIIDRIARVLARGQAEGLFRKDADAVEVHMAVAALGMFNVTNQHTFGAIFQREMGARGDVTQRWNTVADMIVSYLTNFQRRTS
jgi:AcrR family transcriptional regulator